MLNNKGFAVSTVLYTLLIAFLMFLGAALAMFSSSSSLIGKSTDDLVNGNKLRAEQVKAPDVEGKVCGYGRDYQWFQNTDGSPFNTLVRINSKYGTMYWPKDFGIETSTGIITGVYHDNKNIRVECLNENGEVLPSCVGYNLLNTKSEIVEKMIRIQTLEENGYRIEADNKKKIIKQNEYNNIRDFVMQIKDENTEDLELINEQETSYYDKLNSVLEKLESEGIKINNFDYKIDIQPNYRILLSSDTIENIIYKPVLYKYNDNIIFYSFELDEELMQEKMGAEINDDTRRFLRQIGLYDALSFLKQIAFLDYDNNISEAFFTSEFMENTFDEISDSSNNIPFNGWLRITDKIRGNYENLKIYDICS